MFYLLERQDPAQCTVGEHCMTLRDFSGYPAGTKGQVVEADESGITIEWPVAKYVVGSIQPRPWRDRFDRIDMQYLRFATEKHPGIDATVYKTNVASV